MAAEVKLTKITPTVGNIIEVAGNVEIGSDANPKTLDVKGNMTSGGNFTTSGDITAGNINISSDMIADNISIRDTPTEDNHLISKAYFEDTGGMAEGYIYGLEISNGTIPDEQIDIEIGTCKDSTNTRTITLATGTIIDITDSGAGGLDAGTVASDTWYYIWVIYNTSTGTTDAMFSASKTSPTMPSGYDYKRRIRGAVLTDGTADIIPFYQKDDVFKFKSKINDYYTTSPGTSRVLIDVSVPPNMIGYFVLLQHDGGEQRTNLGNTSEPDVTPVKGTCDLYSDGGASSADTHLEVLVDSVGQIYFRTSEATTSLGTWVSTKGFIDPAQE